MASLVEQIFLQANAGSANGASLIEPFAQGMQFGQRQQQIDIQKQQLAAEVAQIPLSMLIKQQDAEMNALKIQSVLEGRQQEIRNTEDIIGLKNTFSRAFSETDDPIGTIRMLTLEALVNNPFLGKDPRFKSLSEQVGEMAQETERLMRAEAYRDYYTGRNDRASEELRLKQEHENRMERQFQFRKEAILNRIPQHRQTEFRTKAEIIKNDINLIGNTEEKIKRLNDLVREFEATTPGAATMPATKAPIPGQPGQTFERDGFKFTPIR